MLGRHFPAMTLVQVVALVEGRAKVEIEATAVVPAWLQGLNYADNKPSRSVFRRIVGLQAAPTVR